MSIMPLPLNKKFAAKLIGFLLITVLWLQEGKAQISETDVVTAADAAARKDGFHNRFGAPGKPTTRSFSFKVSDLQAILDEYKAAGVSEVVFVPSIIRMGTDANRMAARASARKPGVTPAMVTNRFTLLIKGPQDGSVSLKRMFAVSKYYDLATICPPPDNCIE